MTRRWIVNASPLILLGKIGHIALLSELADELIVPEMVVREVERKRDGEQALVEIASLPDARIEVEVSVSSEIVAWNLGRGESQVISLAVAVPGCRAVLDDLQARRCAQSMGLPLIGTLGVVLRAKRKGVIPEARPVIEHLRRVGLYASDALIEQALARLGE
jgi:predicted nucleic acid-binding protein